MYKVVAAGCAAEAPVAWLLHGYLDAGQSSGVRGWPLAHAGIRCYARCGLSGKLIDPPRGAYYHFPEYIADQVGLLRTMNLRGVFLVGHSMGGTVATLLAAAFPEFAKSMALLRIRSSRIRRGRRFPIVFAGGSKTPVKFTPAPEDARKAMSIADAAPRRLRINRPNVSVEQLERITNRFTLPLEGGVKWAFNPLHRARSAVPFFAKSYCAFAKLVKCPVLAVSGGENGFHVTNERERLACFANCREVALEGAGHMMHWTRPEETAKALLQFWAA